MSVSRQTINLIKTFDHLDFHGSIYDPFPKCNSFKLQTNKKLCCSRNRTQCPLNLPTRIPCFKNPCCAHGSNTILWCSK